MVLIQKKALKKILKTGKLLPVNISEASPYTVSAAVRNTEGGQQNKHYRNVLLFQAFSHINAPTFTV